MTASTSRAVARPLAHTLLSWERAIYAVALALAAGLRFFDLAAQPLAPLEAAQSWPAWLAAMGLSTPGAPAPDSPLLFSLQTALFWITQGGDAAARLLPAFVGTAMVLVPWLLRPWLGRPAALALAVLVALDPWLIAFSRLADSAVLSAALTLFALAALARVCLPGATEEARGRWLAWAAAAGGLLLVSGPLAWSFMPMLLLFVVLFTLPALGVEGMAQARRRTGTLTALFAGAALLGSTAWLARPQGTGYLSRSLSVWLAQFEPGDYSPLWAMLRLLADQPFALVFGPLGLFLLWRGRRRLPQPPGRSWPLFVTLWLLWGGIWLLLPGRTPQGLLVLGMALLLAAAHGGAALIENAPERVDWREAGILLGMLTVLLISGRIWLNTLAASPAFDLNLALISLLILLAAVLVVSALAAWGDWARVRWFVGVFVAVWLLFAALGGGWRLAHGLDPEHPVGLLATMTHPELRLLTDDVETLSAHRSGDPHALPVQVQMTAAPDPLLGWQLRKMGRLAWVLSPQVMSDASPMPLVIMSQTAVEGDLAAQPEQPALPAGYIGSDYAVRYGWSPEDLYAGPVGVEPLPDDGGVRAKAEQKLDVAWRGWGRPVLRWLLYREAGASPQSEGVVLWTIQEE